MCTLWSERKKVEEKAHWVKESALSRFPPHTLVQGSYCKLRLYFQVGKKLTEACITFGVPDLPENSYSRKQGERVYLYSVSRVAGHNIRDEKQ